MVERAVRQLTRRQWRWLLIFFPCILLAQDNILWLDGIVAVVNEDPILRSELDAENDWIKRRQQLLGDGQIVPEKQILERLIAGKLQDQQAQQRGLVVADLDLEQALRAHAERQGLSLSDFYRKTEQEGINYAAFRERFRRQILRRRLQNRELRHSIVIAEQDIDKWLQEQQADPDNRAYRLRHILLALPPDADRSARERGMQEAEQVRRLLQKKEDFAALAVRFSDGEKAFSGGDLGWRYARQLPGLFVQALVSAKIGQVIGPLVSNAGLHFLKLEEQRQEKVLQRHRLSHILMRPNTLRGQDATRLELLRVRQKWQQEGTSFAALARRYSEDRTSVAEGGVLGWFSAEEVPTSFSDAVKKTPVGEVSEPFQSAFGWHILWLEEGSSEALVDQQRQRARLLLTERRLLTERQRWLRRLRASAYVEIRLGEDGD